MCLEIAEDSEKQDNREVAASIAALSTALQVNDIPDGRVAAGVLVDAKSLLGAKPNIQILRKAGLPLVAATIQ